MKSDFYMQIQDPVSDGIKQQSHVNFTKSRTTSSHKQNCFSSGFNMKADKLAKIR